MYGRRLLDEVAADRVARKVSFVIRGICNMDNRLTTQEASMCVVLSYSMRGTRQKFGMRLRHAPQCGGVKALTIIGPEDAEGCVAQGQCLLKYCFEHRRKVSWGRIDDLQDISSCRLSLQCFAGCGDELRILDRDDPLCGKVLQQGNLLFRERANLLPVDCQGTEQHVILQ